jgi:hypothetical protein
VYVEFLPQRPLTVQIASHGSVSQYERHQHLQNEKDSRTAMLPTRASPENSMPGSFLYSTHRHRSPGQPQEPRPKPTPHPTCTHKPLSTGRAAIDRSVALDTNQRSLTRRYVSSIPAFVRCQAPKVTSRIARQWRLRLRLLISSIVESTGQSQAWLCSHSFCVTESHPLPLLSPTPPVLIGLAMISVAR